MLHFHVLIVNPLHLQILIVWLWLNFYHLYWYIQLLFVRVCMWITTFVTDVLLTMQKFSQEPGSDIWLYCGIKGLWWLNTCHNVCFYSNRAGMSSKLIWFLAADNM